MWLKLLGSICVIMAGSGLGFIIASRYIERPKQIRQIVSCIASLQSYITYAAYPLPAALVQSTSGIRGPIAILFQRMSDVLENSRWLSPREAWNHVTEEIGEQLVLKRPEREVLEVFCANLGSMNREEQQKFLNMVREQLIGIQNEAESTCRQNVKMYRYLGVCGGLAVAIVLL
ncbi:MAG TPA: stage III sporulation protein AB [Methylomusa anaerophila]|uniref:Stage III sporulation protein SpoAB n=1 Tax=Methylomusa anaerophila TaxID=1930071 RepID=A0A348APA9_9FIRM|nr:stage III sporulation protein AB [Methylomusa anaerophila]BBB92907.1 stage III sporulation protein SpoAB [Methylomusa anaerophila]HML87257.1 stage III sporulation protein AB [Methylomusa anaerophila]